MKKFAVIVAILIVVVAVLFYTGQIKNIPYIGNLISIGSETEKTEPTEKGEKKVHTFSGRVEAVSGSMLTVNPDKKSDEYKSSDKITFSTDKIKITDEKGKWVKADDIGNFSFASVRYSGEIEETYPAKVKAESVVLSKRAYCNVYFVVDGKEIEKLTVKIGESVDSSDMPNAGAYCKEDTHFVCWQNGTEQVLSLENITDNITLNAKIEKN